ncbi:MAG: iron-containing alcohol dehydrogenase [Anaerolineae bacterium]|nr:iron-containing alcohol dehydrogenase [Anaerolineae bacterium]
MENIPGLPDVYYKKLTDWKEERPAALITSPAAWERLNGLLNLPLVVQAEPEQMDYDFLHTLAQNVPAMVKVIYAAGTSTQVTIGKMVAYENNLPLVIVPTELDSDQIFEPHVELMNQGILNNIFTGAAESLVVDWDVILAEETHQRVGIVADMLAIVTSLLDWRYAIKQNKVSKEHTFVPWAAGVAAGIASQTIKYAPGVGRGEIEAMRGVMDLTAISVQLANQLGHSRHQEGTEHYLAFTLQNNGVTGISHAESLAPGIVLTSALHGQDPGALRDALEQAGIQINKVRLADLQLALNDLPAFVANNNLPYAVAHDIDPLSEQIRKALETAGLVGDTGGWVVAGGTAPMQPVQDTDVVQPPAETQG